MTSEPTGVVQDEVLLPPPRRRRGIDRQRGRPMWGCVRGMGCIGGLIVLVLLLIGGAAWYYLGTTSFEEFVRLRIERNLESKLDRDVVIDSVEVVRTGSPKIILRGIRIANVPGGARKWFAEAKEVEITGGIESFWQRRISLGRIDIREPRLSFEVFEEGAKLQHNVPSWKRSAPRKYEITRLDIKKLFVERGAFEFLDHRHEITAVASNISSEVTPKFTQQIYEGVMNSPLLRVRIQDYQPFDLNLRGGFLYRPGVLDLRSIAMRGRGIEAFLQGQLNPLTEAVYDFRITSRIELARVKEIFAVENTLDGLISMGGRLRGKSGDFSLTGDFRAPGIEADAYDLASVRGTMDVNGERIKVHIGSAGYGGGTVTGDYLLSEYAEPYPMSIDLRYDGISIEKLFADWGTENTGLRAAATGRLQYQWNKDDILGGQGEGTATLEPGAKAFGDAPYPIAVGGETAFGLRQGVVHFRQSRLSTPQSTVAFQGSLRIEDLFSDLAITIDSRDFSELDRVAFNFARLADKDDYELLGLGGTGRIVGTVKGTIEEPQVIAHIVSSGTTYNEVQLGEGNIRLRYDGTRSVLTFDEGTTFSVEGGNLAMRGTISFPDSGPSPVFDLAIDAQNFPVERAIQLVELDLVARGRGTGRLFVTGSPDDGKVRFERLQIAQGDSKLNLNGIVDWNPGEGNVSFDLDIGADRFPVSDVAAFLELGELPVTGLLTGTLHLEGPKAALEGAGSVTVREGTVFGEPIDVASADLSFVEGRVRATAVRVQSAAGVITGEAEYDLATERFSYIVNAQNLDVTRFKILSSIASIVQGKLNITSSGAGTAEQPELVVEGTITDASVQGLEIPEGASIPQFYLAIRNGQIVIRASAFDVVNIEGGGTIDATGNIDATARATISDIGRVLRIVAAAPDLPAEGNAVIDVRVGGKFGPIEGLVIEGSVPQLALSFSGEEFRPAEPIRFSVRNGVARIDSLRILHHEGAFSLAGTVGLSGAYPLDLSLNGEIDAALIQLIAPEMRATKGTINVAAGITGTMEAPRINGTAEVLDGQLKIAGFPQLIDEIQASLVFRGNRLEIDSLRATVGGGSVIAGGFVALDGLKLERIRITMQGTDVVLRYFEGISVQGDFTLLLSGDMDRAVLQGDVNVDRALYFRDFDLTTSVLNLILERRGLAPAVAASWQDRINLRIHMNAPDALAIRNNIADVTASAEIDLTGTLANPIIIGLVTIDEGGKIRFQDVDYRVVRGSINFQNPFRIDPYFDITAEARVQEYDLSVNLTGTLDRITPSITSDPPISDLSLLALLGPSSIGQDRRGLGLSAESLQSTGTSLLYQSLGGLIGARIFPFADAVRLDVDPLSTEPTVTMEKRISNDVRVIVIYNTSNNENREIIEWQVTRDWVLELTRDSEQEDTYIINAVDARFRRRYRGYW